MLPSNCNHTGPWGPENNCVCFLLKMFVPISFYLFVKRSIWTGHLTRRIQEMKQRIQSEMCNLTLTGCLLSLSLVGSDNVSGNRFPVGDGWAGRCPQLSLSVLRPSALDVAFTPWSGKKPKASLKSGDREEA